MAKRLFIDLEKCRRCEKCTIRCGYFYHPDNLGILALREFSTFAVICRQCEEANCVRACPKEALEKQPDGVLRRYNLRCISCKSCAVACPFGTILTDLVPYYSSACDYCLGRPAGKTEEAPECVVSCPEHALEYREVSEDVAQDIYLVGERLAVHAVSFKRNLDRELIK